MPVQSVAVAALALVNVPVGPLGFELSSSDVESVMSPFGRVCQVVLLQSSLSSVWDCAAVIYSAPPGAAEAASAELHGTLLPEIGTLAIVPLPMSLVESCYCDPAILGQLVYCEAAGALAPRLDAATTAHLLMSALGPVEGPDFMESEAGRKAVTAFRTDASFLKSLLQHVRSQAAQPTAHQPPQPTIHQPGVMQPVVHSVQSVQPVQPVQSVQSSHLVPHSTGQHNNTSHHHLQESNHVHMIGSGREFGGLPHPLSTRPKKRVCRLELVDLFGGYPEFDVVAAVCGPNGNNINYVLKEAKEKCDIDLDGVPANHAPVAERLHLTVTALDDETYNTAVETLEDLLGSVCQQYTEFCLSRGTPAPATLGFRRHEYIEGAEGQLVYLGPKQQPSTTA